MRNLRKIAFVFTLSMSSAIFAQAEDNEGRAAIVDYISQYESIAIVEMHRTGIPASIKLAQAILESNAGRSYLAKEANNHFGIKCGGAWQGGTIYRKDDDYDRHGKLRQSCFRAYDNGSESFIAHSNFLTDYRKAHRYGFLFNLKPDDYKGWARGLKKAGYATNPKYANLLINIIESYELHKYDFMEAPLAMQSSDQKDKKVEEEVVKKEEVKEEVAVVEERAAVKDNRLFAGTADAYQFKEHNGVRYIKAGRNDEMYIIAMDLKMSVEELLEYNDGAYNRAGAIKAGDRIYLEPKANKFRGRTEAHRVSKGETMVEIAQLYGIKLDKLYKRNRMQEGTQPQKGERILLNKKRKKDDNVRLRDPRKEIKAETITPIHNEVNEAIEEKIDTQSQEVVVDEPKVAEKVVEKQPVNTPPINAGPAQKQPIPRREETVKIAERKMHVVSKGETLYRISIMYNTSVDQIKKVNGLNSNDLRIGQELIIE